MDCPSAPGWYTFTLENCKNLIKMLLVVDCEQISINDLP